MSLPHVLAFTHFFSTYKNHNQATPHVPRTRDPSDILTIPHPHGEISNASKPFLLTTSPRNIGVPKSI